jgi:hypothetical protein
MCIIKTHYVLYCLAYTNHKNSLITWTNTHLDYTKNLSSYITENTDVLR